MKLKLYIPSTIIIIALPLMFLSFDHRMSVSQAYLLSISGILLIGSTIFLHIVLFKQKRFNHIYAEISVILGTIVSIVIIVFITMLIYTGGPIQ